MMLFLKETVVKLFFQMIMNISFDLQCVWWGEGVAGVDMCGFSSTRKALSV
jgi:hypothetical protein